MILSKKAITEITSFILLTLIVVVFSSIAYFFLSGELEENTTQIDRNNMEQNLKKFDFISRNIMAYENSTISFPISFKSGALIFEGDSLYYQSLVPYSDVSIVCFDEVCYYGDNGYEKIFITLGLGYEFADNFSLSSGNYILILTNLKNESEIKVNTR